MTPRGACGLAVQLPIQFATCASAAGHAHKDTHTIAAATTTNIQRSTVGRPPRKGSARRKPGIVILMDSSPTLCLLREALDGNLGRCRFEEPVALDGVPRHREGARILMNVGFQRLAAG